MKLPISWLKDYLDIEDDAAEVARRLTAVGHMQDAPPQNIGGDTVLSLEVRQNRPDCLSIAGLARELAAVYKKKATPPVEEFAYANLVRELSAGPVKIIIEDPALCYRFNTLAIDGIKVGPTPLWIKKRLESCGVKSLNNLIDITNFIMLELGQPMHAFDTKRIKGGTLAVRTAGKGESLMVLGRKKIYLDSDDLVIADAQEPLGLAGVIGGETSGVSTSTTSIILEAATYNQANIRRTSRRHNIRTEASTRLEKFLHPQLTEAALARAAQLIREICGGKVIGHNDAYPAPKELGAVDLPLKEVARLGGVKLNTDEIKKTLENLGLKITEGNQTLLKVKAPYSRTDLGQPADLVEEVIRIYGYEKIPQRLPINPPPPELEFGKLQLEERARDILTGLGFDEQITEPLTNEKNPQRKPAVLENSLSREKSMLRTNMGDTLVEGLKTHRKHYREAVRLFEIGKVYFMEGSKPKEERQIAAILSGPQESYRTAKGVVEVVLARIGHKDANQSTKIKKIADAEHPTFFFSLKTDELYESEWQNPTQITTSPPHLVFEDLSTIVGEKTPVGEMIQAIKSASNLIDKVEVGEVYQDNKLKSGGKKSVFFNLTYKAEGGEPLGDQNIAPVREKLIRALQKGFNAQLRG